MPTSRFFDLSKPTAILAIGLMAIILIMVLPVPAWVMDIGLTASFAFAILIFTTSIFIEKPLDFSSFPSVLLASLMLRLALNVSSTKLIISQGHTGTDAAGNVIEGFAMFILIHIWIECGRRRKQASKRNIMVVFHYFFFVMFCF